MASKKCNPDFPGILPKTYYHFGGNKSTSNLKIPTSFLWFMFLLMIYSTKGIYVISLDSLYRLQIVITMIYVSKLLKANIE